MQQESHLGGNFIAEGAAHPLHIFETESQENILPMPIDVGFS